MSSNPRRTPSGIMDFYMACSRAPNDSPQSSMARTEEPDLNAAEPWKVTRAVPSSSVPATSFALADKELLETGKYADAKVIANGKTYDVHKSILCTRSKWFRKVLESAFREGRESVVEISAPDNIARLLEFLYTGAVDLTNDNDLMTAVNELSILGDFYLSEEMHAYATKVLGQYLGEFLNSICDVELLELPEIPVEYATREYQESLRWFQATDARRKLNFRSLNEMGFINRLCAAIRSAYATPSGIHRVYVDFVYAARIHTFGHPLIQDLRDEIPEFGYDILSALMTGPMSSAFKGNKAFEQWKDGLANPETAAMAMHSPSQEDQQLGRHDSAITARAPSRGRNQGTWGNLAQGW